MKKIILIVFTILMGCTKGTDDVPFYEFNEEDYKFLPTVYENLNVVRFINQFDEEIILEVQLYEISKERVGGISLDGGSSPIADVSKFEVKLGLQGSECSSLYFFTYKDIDSIKSWFEINDTPCNGYSTYSFEKPYPMTQLQIGNTTYDKVLILDTDFTAAFSNEYEFNKFYFDLKSGIVGFDDTVNNIEFRIVN
ncbi:MAG: hypothetical protein R2793_02680 [Flavobacteriaceae bacterium]